VAPHRLFLDARSVLLSRCLPLLIFETQSEVSSWFSFLSPSIRMVGAWLPNSTSWWIDAYAANPGRFAGGAFAVGILLYGSARIAVRITDEMRRIWQQIIDGKIPADKLPNNWICRLINRLNRLIYWLRTRWYYRKFFGLMREWLLPTIFALLFLCVPLVAVSRVLFTVGDSFGYVCRGSKNPQPALGLVPEMFKTNSLCWNSGRMVRAEQLYDVIIKPEVQPSWSDDSIPTTPEGFGRQAMTWPMYYASFPFRRHISG
jgi:hypothetical protein